MTKPGFHRQTQNAHKKQAFTTLDLIGLVLLVAIVGSVSGGILAQTFQADARQKAMRSAESLNHDLWMKEGRQLREPTETLALNGRAPALAAAEPMVSGLAASDPWGHPFHYQVRKVHQATDGSKSGHTVIRVTVWSDGPNGRAESESSRAARLSESTGSTTSAQAYVLGGDDVGYTRDYPTD